MLSGCAFLLMDCPSFSTGSQLQEVVYCCGSETILMRGGQEEGRVPEVLEQCLQLLGNTTPPTSNLVLTFTASIMSFLFMSGVLSALVFHFRVRVVQYLGRLIDLIETGLNRAPPAVIVPAPGRPVLNGPQHPGYHVEMDVDESESETTSQLAEQFPDNDEVINGPMVLNL